MSQVRVHRTAPKIAERMGEILGEPFSDDQVYQWVEAKKIRTFKLGPHICALDTTLLEDLTGQK
jgi:hypothetical protein